MPVMPDHWIRKQAIERGMIEPFVEGLKSEGVISYGVSSYGYDARVADEFKIFTNVDSAVVDPKQFSDKSFVNRQTDVCVIPPNSFALARTVEYFRIPRDTLVICLGKSTYARCFTGDTKVALVDGTSATFTELQKRADNGERHWGYSVDDTGQVVMSELTHPRKIGREKVIEIELDNGEVIRSTPDHKFMMRDGSYREAKDLDVGVSLFPLYRAAARGYEAVLQPSSGRMEATHRLADDWNVYNGVYSRQGDQHRHHINHNRRDNRPTNIARVDANEHIKHHNAIMWNDPAFRERHHRSLMDGLRKSMNSDDWAELATVRGRNAAASFWADERYAATRERLLKARRRRMANLPPAELEARREHMRVRMLSAAERRKSGERLKALWKDPAFVEERRSFARSLNLRPDINEETVSAAFGQTGSIRGAAKFLNVDRSAFRRFAHIVRDYKEQWENASLKSKEVLNALMSAGSVRGAARLLNVGRKKIMSFTEALREFYGSPIAENHKVVAIREVEGIHDVYCLTVPEHGNFALEGGVFVKNCGIIVNVTPLEPEWEGHVTLEFSNTTPLPAKIYANEGACQFIFLEAESECEVSYGDRKGKYMGQRGVTMPRMM